MSSVKGYDIIFVVTLACIAFLPWVVLTLLAKFLIYLFPLFIVGTAIYYLGFRPETWQTDVSHHDQIRYSRAARRSSCFFAIALVVVFLFSRLFKVDRTGIFYKYFSIFVVTVLAYIFDRSIALDDGLEVTKQHPVRGITDGFMSLYSPSFMRFLFIIPIEIILSLGLVYLILPVIPDHYKVIRYIIGGFIIPFAIFSVVTGQLRFRWAYPNVHYENRLTNIPVYIICFSLLATLAFATKSKLLLLITLIIIACILQYGGFSNTEADYTLKQELVFSTPTGIILAIITLAAVLMFGWMQFKYTISKYIPVGNYSYKDCISVR